jgi:hypothetical protein
MIRILEDHLPLGGFLRADLGKRNIEAEQGRVSELIGLRVHQWALQLSKDGAEGTPQPGMEASGKGKKTH